MRSFDRKSFYFRMKILRAFFLTVFVFWKESIFCCGNGIHQFSYYSARLVNQFGLNVGKQMMRTKTKRRGKLKEKFYKALVIFPPLFLLI